MAKTIPTDFFKTSLPVVLVAGGAGFMGSHVCEKLLSKNVKVVCIDNWQKGSQKNIEHLLKDDKFYFLEHDINKGLPKNIIKVNYIIGLSGAEIYLSGEDLSIEALELISVGTRNLLQVAQERKARFLLVSVIDVGWSSPVGRDTEAKKFAETITNEYGLKREVDVRIVKVGDVYGPRMMLSPNSILPSIIKNTIYNEPLIIPDGGETHIFPVFIDDVIEGLEKALFTTGTRLSTITLAGPKTSALSLAETVRSIKSGLEIRFGGMHTGRTVNSPPSVKRPFSWEAKTPLEQGLVKTLDWFRKEHKAISQNPTGAFWANGTRHRKIGDSAKPVKTQKRKIPWLLALFLGGLLFWFFLLPLLEIGAGTLQLYFAKRALVAGQPKDALAWSARAAPWFGFAENGVSRWTMIPFLGKGSTRLSKNTRSLAQAAQLVETASVAFIKAENFFAGVLGREPFSLKQTAEDLSVELNSLEKQLAFIEADLKEKNFIISPFPFITIYSDKELGLARMRQAIGTIAKILSEAGGLLGEDGIRKYLILFQNNAELRPTGGFIGSFAIATFEQGKLSLLDVQDVYSADGQLKGHVEPPLPIKEHLGEANWFLRDSNWSPNFPTSAERAAWFIDKELGQTIDGVVALDLNLVKQFLLETGEINLADFNQTITADNLYEKAQTAAEGDFFPGSRAKKNFLAALAKALLLRITEDPKKNLMALAKAAFTSFEERHLALWIADDKINAILRQSGWDGSVRNIFCGQTQTGCIPDYLQAVEANLGVNKANYFLDRAYSLEITLGVQKISHTLTLSYKNNSRAGVWPGGDYKNYIRLFVPRGTSFVSASIKNPASGKQDVLDINREEEAGKAVLGTPFLVPAGESREFSIIWETPTPELKSKGELLFLWQKQAGTQSDPVWLNISLPDGHNITSVPAPSLTRGSTVGYNTTLVKDLFIDLLWQQRN